MIPLNPVGHIVLVELFSKQHMKIAGEIVRVVNERELPTESRQALIRSSKCALPERADSEDSASCSDPDDDLLFENPNHRYRNDSVESFDE